MPFSNGKLKLFSIFHLLNGVAWLKKGEECPNWHQFRIFVEDFCLYFSWWCSGRFWIFPLSLKAQSPWLSTSFSIAVFQVCTINVILSIVMPFYCHHYAVFPFSQRICPIHVLLSAVVSMLNVSCQAFWSTLCMKCALQMQLLCFTQIRVDCDNVTVQVLVIELTLNTQRTDREHRIKEENGSVKKETDRKNRRKESSMALILRSISVI